MKLCNICKTRKIKNNYTVCYDCNQKSDTVSETNTVVYKKENIPECVRNCLWINYFKESRVGVCLCCKREQITISNFHAGHIQAEANEGRTALDNLIPLCQLCNLSMATNNVFDFITKYNLHYGL